MATNYMKIKNGVSQGEWTLDPSVFPAEAGVSWVSFDPEAVMPCCSKLENGVVVEDATKRTAFDKGPTRIAALAAMKAALVTKTWDALSVAERKVVVGLMPTDAELGI